MSKLIEKLETVLRSGAKSALGFGAARSRAKNPPLVLAASLPAREEELATFVSAGVADAAILPSEKEQSLSSLRTSLAALGNLPWGLRVEKITTEEAKLWEEAGCDFFLFKPQAMRAGFLTEVKAGKIIEIDIDLADSWVRGLERLPIDAVLANGSGEGTFTIERLMAFSRLSTLLRKPLLALVPGSFGGTDLAALEDARIAGLAVDKDATLERLRELKQAIELLPPRGSRPSERVLALIPHLSPEAPSPAKEEEEEEEEEE